MPPPASRAVWKTTLMTFCKKLSLYGSGRIVLKNPFHSTRIILLKKMFPKAKFIHIHRNPTRVIPSTIRMWKIEGMHNSLREGKTAPSLDNAISIYDTMLSKIRDDLHRLPEHDYCTISFEELKNAPVATRCDALASIDIRLDGEQVERLHEFTDSVKNYRQNRYTLSSEQIDYIESKLHHHIHSHA